MEHLVLSCLESRLEADHSIYGRFLIGPFKVGQGTTVATALRRALLSELHGVAITAVGIRGAAHEYAAIEGVRESALDVVLNLKQVVLTGEAKSELPAIGYLSMHGPKAVKARDLKLPSGIRCVDGNQHIATISANGVLTMKVLISSGKGYLAHHSQWAELGTFSSLQPRLREEGVAAWAPSVNESAHEIDPMSLRWHTTPLDLRHKRALSTNPRRPLHISGDANDIVQYGYRRRLASSSLYRAHPSLPHQRRLLRTKPNGMPTPQSGSHALIPPVDSGMASQAQQSQGVYGARGQDRPTSPFPETPSAAGPQGEGHSSQPPAYQADVDPLVFAAPPLRTGAGVSGASTGKGTSDGHRGSERSHMAISKGDVSSVSVSDQGNWERSSGPMLPVDAVFMPIHRVNFLVQTDDQWPEPRERVILEIWTNGSIHPRQAIAESATLLVHLFSLFRQAEPLVGRLPPAYPHSPQPSKGGGEANGLSPVSGEGGRGPGYSQSEMPGVEASKGLLGRTAPKIAAPKASLGSPHHRLQGSHSDTKPHKSMDVGNLTISVQAYIALKQAGIETVSELLSGGRGWMGAVAESDNALVHEIKDALASLTGTDGDHGLL